MDRLETSNMTIVSGLIEHECSFANPTNSVITDVDLRNCFCNGGRINLYDHKCTETKICCRVRETPFPVYECSYVEEEGTITGFDPENEEDPKIARSGLDCITSIGYELEQAEDEEEIKIEPPFDMPWTTLSDYAETPAGEYWQKEADRGDNIAASYVAGRFPFMHFFLDCEITFYGQAESPCIFAGYVAGGFLHANTFDWTVTDPSKGLCEIVIDTQDWEEAPYSNDPAYEVSRQKMVADFTNDTLEEWETRYLAYYVRPQPVRLSFTEVIAYNVQIGDIGTYPNAGGITNVAEPIVDFSNVSNVKWGYGSLTLDSAPSVQGGFLAVEPPVELTHFDVKTITAEFGDSLTIEKQASFLSTKLSVTTDLIMDVASTMAVEEGEIGETLLVSGLSTITASTFRVSDESTIDTATLTMDKGKFFGEFSAVGSTLNGLEYSFSDSASFSGCKFSFQEGIFMDEGTFANCEGEISDVYASEVISIIEQSEISVDKWVGVLPTIEPGSILTTGSYSPA